MVAILFRYADFIKVIGGTEFDLGLIVGLGTIGSLAARAAQGVAIDHYGPRRIWMISLVLLLGSLLLHLAIASAHSPWIYVVRIGYSTGLAGCYGASITYTFQRVPPHLMAEAVGTLGTSGFLGLIAGGTLCDWLSASETLSERGIQDRLFLFAAATIAFSGVCAWWATLQVVRPRPRRRPSLIAVVRRYHPGTLLLMCVTLGFGVCIHYTFLRPFEQSLHINGVAPFYNTYAVTAFVTRIMVRGWPQRYGSRPIILIGMAWLVASFLLYLIVQDHTTWELLIPAFAAGVAHALLFPAIVASGSGEFPGRYRGLGTALMLATFDVGTFIGAPIVGKMIEACEQHAWPVYPVTFATLAAGFSIITLFYAWVSRPSRDSQIPPADARIG